MDKNEIRQIFRRKRGEANLKGKDEEIYYRLSLLDVYLNAEEVFIYLSYGTEVSTFRILDDALGRGKKIAVPRVMDKQRMEFVWFDGFQGLETNKMGIKEPIGGKVAQPGRSTVFIIPGLGFSETMDRVGYGGGYYDAYLAGVDVVKIGLCYEIQIVKALPCEAWDVKMDYIVTEERVLMGFNN